MCVVANREQRLSIVVGRTVEWDLKGVFRAESFSVRSSHCKFKGGEVFTIFSWSIDKTYLNRNIELQNNITCV